MNAEANSATPISLFDLFKIGIGPSSSHTTGPMRAARMFLDHLHAQDVFADTTRITVTLFGSLALTGKGHASDKAIMLGLDGLIPDTIDPDAAEHRYAAIRATGRLRLDGSQEIPFREGDELILDTTVSLSGHPNGMRFIAHDDNARLLLSADYHSVGGGSVVAADGAADDRLADTDFAVPYPFGCAAELLAHCRKQDTTIAKIVLQNEVTRRPPADVRTGILSLRDAMLASIDRGCRTEGILPGKFGVKRRAKELFDDLERRPAQELKDPLSALDWVSLYALAVNEENATGGRVVTAPTNGAAGIVPAVLAYYERFIPGATDDGAVTFLATAAAIGGLYKQNASISAAEVGCQGEVGVACSMAAGALAAVLGGSVMQIENAAEIGMEHNLGLTCDPVGGMVQIPCIERNTMGTVKAINAARLALRGDGTHLVSLDSVIETMRQTGVDMSERYKETALGGLAVNISTC